MNNILIIFNIAILAYMLTELFNIADGFIAKWQLYLEDKKLQKELNKRIKRIKRYNKHDLIENNIKPFLREQFYGINGIYPTDKQLHRLAVNSFKQSKELGYIDCLNARKI